MSSRRTRSLGGVGVVQQKRQKRDDDEDARAEGMKPEATVPVPLPGPRKWKDFAVNGELHNMPLMVVEIKGFGPLTFPFYSEKFFQLLKAEPAVLKSDYSLGDKRVFDGNVRNSYEINASNLMIITPGWQSYMEKTILPKVGADLGFDPSRTHLVLQKMLFYEKGSFFTAHTDKSRLKGHFGTLLIQLPSKYTGGQLHCSYGSLEKVFDHSSRNDIQIFAKALDGHTYTVVIDPTETVGSLKDKCAKKTGMAVDQQRILYSGYQLEDGRTLTDYNFRTSVTNEMVGFYSAFYLDVQHEVKEVTSGFRVSLAYSLVDISANTPFPLRTTDRIGGGDCSTIHLVGRLVGD